MSLTIIFAIHKIKPGTLIVGSIRSNFKGTNERFVGCDNAITFMSSVKRKLA